MRSRALWLALTVASCSGGGPGASSSGTGTSGGTDGSTSTSTLTSTSTGSTGSTGSGSTGSTGGVDDCGCPEGEVCVVHITGDAPDICGPQCKPLPPECGDAPTCGDLACVWELCNSLYCNDETTHDCGLPSVAYEGFGCVDPALTCQYWNQDCIPEEKCVPIPGAARPDWYGPSCAVPGTDAPGEPCTRGESPTEDSCAHGAVCWNVDPATNAGTCVALCGGKPYAPECDAGTRCAMTSPNDLAVCLPPCDPLADPCADGNACMAIGDTTGCVHARADPVAFGDPCVHPNDCAPGLACAPATAVPGCADDRCCTAMCDLQSPTCPDAGQSCTAYFTDPPAGLEHVGICRA